MEFDWQKYVNFQANNPNGQSTVRSTTETRVPQQTNLTDEELAIQANKVAQEGGNAAASSLKPEVWKNLYGN